MDTISVKWVNVALEAVRQLGKTGSSADRARIGPPMVARSLALLHTAIYDAWAVHDAVALPTRLRLVRVSGATDQQIEAAISQAAYKVLADQFPTQAASSPRVTYSSGLWARAMSPGPQMIASMPAAW